VPTETAIFHIEPGASVVSKPHVVEMAMKEGLSIDIYDLLTEGSIDNLFEPGTGIISPDGLLSIRENWRPKK
jgi:hypothetical protein